MVNPRNLLRLLGSRLKKGGNLCQMCIIASFRCWITPFVQNFCTLVARLKEKKKKTKGGGGMFFILIYSSLQKKVNYPPVFHRMLAWDEIHTNRKSTQKFDNKNWKKTSSPPPAPTILFLIFIFKFLSWQKIVVGRGQLTLKVFRPSLSPIYGGFRGQCKNLGKPTSQCDGKTSPPPQHPAL